MFIITAKNIRDGNDHVTDPTKRTEICTEMIMTRLKAIELLNTGQISREDVIVTRRDRFCLYENLFDTIWDYERYESNSVFISPSHVIDLAARIDELDQTMPWKPFYGRYEQDKKQILDIATDPFKPIERRSGMPFICILNRQTPNHPEKNIGSDYWDSFIREVGKLRKIGLDPKQHCQLYVYTFGSPVPSISYWHITSFRAWCSVLADPNCKCVVAPCTGGVYPIFFTGHSNSKTVIVDDGKLTEKHAESPSFYNNCINFTRVSQMILSYNPKPTPKDLAHIVVNYAEL